MDLFVCVFGFLDVGFWEKVFDGDSSKVFLIIESCGDDYMDVNGVSR